MRSFMAEVRLYARDQIDDQNVSKCEKEFYREAMFDKIITGDEKWH